MPRIQRYLHWYSLHDLGEIPRGVVGRQKRTLRTAGGGDLFHLPMQHDPWKSVDLDVGYISLSDVGELRLQVVGQDPHVAPDQVHHLIPAVTSCPSCTWRLPTSPSVGAVMRVYPRLTSATVIAALFASMSAL